MANPEQPDFKKLLESVYKEPDGAKRVEQALIRLLTLLLAEHKKPLEVSDVSRFDAFAPAGIAGIGKDIPGPTVVEITRNLKRVLSSGFAPDLQKVVARRSAKSVLLIATHSLKAERMSPLQSDPRFHGILFEFWGPEEVSALLAKYPDAVAGLVPNLGPRAVAAMVRRADSDWTERRIKHLSELRRVYFTDRLSLFLGAGVSVDCGIPVWKELITNLALQMVEEQTPKDAQYESRGMTSSERREIALALVTSQDSSPLLVARYLENSLGGDFTQKLHAVLYQSVGQHGTNTLIAAIARLCRPSRQREGVRAVVTYNFDDLLESALSADETKCRPIFEEGHVPEADELPVYHVHGRLPQLSSDEASSRLVFSEESYLALQSDPYSWANFEQLKLLRENTCLLLGLSGTDPNLRRLLDIDFRQSKRAKHYICLKRLTAKDLFDPSRQTTVRSTVAEHFLNVHHSLLEHSFSDLGLNVIWIRGYEELPAILQQIRSVEVNT
jgi:hypothetical protein